MNSLYFELTKCYQAAFDYSLMRMFRKLLEINTKPEELSQSTYLTFLAITLLENLGNQFPTQKEIDATELILKRYRNRKYLKNIYKLSCMKKSIANNVAQNNK